ncbi:FAD/NAD(P)-binding domain-containing protein [Karstenula rhodostoma CBS 690.94]|uniref:FAD/NAD(P)-binding domain-containing protein n=1 Tax=Karstenula rhodostoma CBS 690.94 TaxID=1392251 RepID=A0A9P4PDI9_9PLEO|nr:FAD/NAD(P)-binding domain-containing protein [Karstenula rhodostoma CBS 690.94]
MVSDYILLALHIFRVLPEFAATIIRQRISNFFHGRSYKALPDDHVKNVVVIGGSFGGYQAVKRLTETLPTGYRVVLVEKNSHLNYVFAFPRFSVVTGNEQDAFIPYSGLSKGALEGIFHHVQDTAMDVTERFVELKNGEKFEYEYLVIATGTSSRLPSKVASTESRDAQQELRGMQEKIQHAERIAIVGGGAVGVELASDIKDFYPDKDVTLVHSRAQLLNSFGSRLHNHIVKTLTDMGVTLQLNVRPKFSSQTNVLKFANGEEKEYDLVLLDDRFPHIFAFGDVAATGGPKMGRAALFQAEIVIENIRKLIKRSKSLSTYKPNIALEGAIKLTLGKVSLRRVMA